jgi:molybdopterin converting factor small subunit
VPGTRVTVRLSGSLGERLGNRLVVDLDPGARVRDLLEALAADGELGDRACDGLAVVAGGSIVAHDRVLVDGDELDVLVPVAGG